jgi:hypothetical protein
LQADSPYAMTMFGRGDKAEDIKKVRDITMPGDDEVKSRLRICDGRLANGKQITFH